MNMKRRLSTAPNQFLLRKLYSYLHDTPGPTFAQIRKDNPNLSALDLGQRLLRLEADGWVSTEGRGKRCRYWAKVWT